jgi:hypothetical protein
MTTAAHEQATGCAREPGVGARAAVASFSKSSAGQPATHGLEEPMHHPWMASLRVSSLSWQRRLADLPETECWKTDSSLQESRAVSEAWGAEPMAFVGRRQLRLRLRLPLVCNIRDWEDSALAKEGLGESSISL